MDRRAFFGTLTGSLLAGPLAAGAQQPPKLRRIGILNYTLPTADMAGFDPKSPYVGAFIRGMRDLGYVYGRHFVTEPRGGDAGPERIPALVSELLNSKVDIVITVAASLPAVTRATSTTPIVV